MKPVIEICCGSFEDCLAVEKGGATRIELTSALNIGGLTPSIATLILCKKFTNLEVISMVRPRGGGFCYSDTEFMSMLEDAKQLLEFKSDGIIFGCLTKEGKINVEQTKQMANLIKSYNKQVVFHRAYDCLCDAFEGAETLIECGVDRVLTSGLETKAINGIACIHELIKRYEGKLEILPGCGINEGNVLKVLNETGATQIHSSCKGYKQDVTTVNNEKVSYAYLSGDLKSCYECVDVNAVEKLVNVVYGK